DVSREDSASCEGRTPRPGQQGGARRMDTTYRGCAFRGAIKVANWGGVEGKVAAVTGGASGIGEATVRRFVAEGASVAFCDRDGERGERVAAVLETAGAKVACSHADVGTEAVCLAFVNGAAEKFGRLDILINNAGIRKYEKVEEASAASWNEILNVNLMSYVFCAKAAVPLMRANKGGAIVNVASVRSVVSGGGNLQYDTTKAAIAGLTRALAADHSSEGIRVNAVGPGPIFTPFHQRRIAAAGETRAPPRCGGGAPGSHRPAPRSRRRRRPCCGSHRSPARRPARDRFPSAPGAPPGPPPRPDAARGRPGDRADGARLAPGWWR